MHPASRTKTDGCFQPVWKPFIKIFLFEIAKADCTIRMLNKNAAIYLWLSKTNVKNNMHNCFEDFQNSIISTFYTTATISASTLD